ncbi:AraC family transcriptional regulator [Pseudochrobactrum asaccharolyticum]|uniref:AraC family transcriptional regulator n=1 Tax=Pseudochrobactrum asaccharolyticum TaxID=354351 RepID=A0A366DK36_9HYPH|nr:AraC family transcriptional regulator [Pseudochrobactrum asaccharolyticum]MBX8803167.1 helix-turn-helix transcriptional regulator [Ochrobactrum sp. MR28]MBX8818733.1 helix-turn-helix transcriptional regulator [Ochrobactrum sp. MR31]RBO90396.1 AraC family transcriptional regulator [Pseudochrobactrum asaccharolyticum]
MSDALRIASGRFGRVALLDMDKPLVRHAHPHCHVLLKVEGADTQFSVKDSLVPLTDESAVLINSWEPHAYEHNCMMPKTIILALYVEPKWLSYFRPNWAASNSPDFFEKNVGAITPHIHSLTRTLAEAMMYEPENAKYHETLLADLMIAVIERFTAWKDVQVSVRDIASLTSIDFRIRKAIRLMKEAPETIADLDGLASSVGLSRAHFYRLFESATGVSPRIYINVQRVEQAVMALSDGSVPLATVADRLGFSASSHFSRFFHDNVGSTPSSFRSASFLASK